MVCLYIQYLAEILLTLFENLEYEGAQKRERKLPFNAVQIKYIAMHITNKKNTF